MNPVALGNEEQINPCCASLKEKYLKSESRRRELREALKISTKQIDMLQTENSNLKKVYDDERIRADKEREEKMKGLEVKVSLENQISVLKSENSSFQLKGQLEVRDTDEAILHSRVSEFKIEINRLKELLEQQTLVANSLKEEVASEKEKVIEAWKIVEVEKNKANEEKVLHSRLSELEREINRLNELLEKEKMKSKFLNDDLIPEENDFKAHKVLEVEKSGTDEKIPLGPCAFESEMEINKLIKLFEKEKSRADLLKAEAAVNKEKAAKAWKIVVAEKKRADDEKKNCDSERQKNQEQRIQSEIIKKDAQDARLVLETFKEENRKLETEMQMAIQAKQCADSKRLKAEEKLAEKNMGLVAEKKTCIYLSQQLEEAKLKIKELQKDRDEFMSSNIVVESRKKHLNKFDDATNKEFPYASRHGAQKILESTEDIEFVEMYRKKAMEEKHRADELVNQLELNRQMIEDLHKQIHSLENCRNVKGLENGRAEPKKIMFLKKQLKFLKMQLKHADDVANFEKGRSVMFHQEVCHLKQDLVQILGRLNGFGDYFSCCSEGKDGHTKTGYFTDMRGSCLQNAEQFRMCHQSDRQIVRPHLSAVNSVKTIAGIDSKLEPLLGGSDQKLQGSTITSCLASFSNRQLLGSQERGAFSFSTSLDPGKETSREEPVISNFSGEVTGINFSERDATAAENSVGKVRIREKRKRIHDAIESVELLYPDEKKLLVALHDLGDKESVKSLKHKSSSGSGGRLHLNSKRLKSRKKQKDCDNKQELVLQLCDSGMQKKDDIEASGSKKVSTVYRKDDYPSNTPIDATKSCMDKLIGIDRFKRDMLVDFLESNNGNYMKLLELDNAGYEECYKKAIERPMSPTLPDIGFLNCPSFHRDESNCPAFNGKILTEIVNSGQFDGCIPVNLNNLKLSIPATLENPAFQKRGLHSSGVNGEDGAYNNLGIEVPVEKSNSPLKMIEEKKFQRESKFESMDGGLPVCFILFSDNADLSSISRIFSATKACITQCLLPIETEWLFREILLSFHHEDQLSQKEKVCVLFSILLLQISISASMVSDNFLSRESNLCMDSFASHIHLVESDSETRRMFDDLFTIDDLFLLFEDFVVNRKLLVNAESSTVTSHDHNSSVNIISGDNTLALYVESATSCQLVAGSIIVASISAAFGQTTVMCDISYRVFQIHGFASSLLLSILHVFAHLGGSKYLDMMDNNFATTVMKSIITFFEDKKDPIPSISKGAKSPFLEGAIPVDTVVSLLLEQLRRCDLSGPTDLMGSVNLLNSSKLSYKSNAEENSGFFNCVSSCCLSDYRGASSQPMSLCHLSDILSLVELFASKMTWHWTCEKIVSRLLEILESCLHETLVIAIVTLLGEIGRFGADSNGYEDIGVENIRCRLCGFLSSCVAKNAWLGLQTATVGALLRLVSLDLKELCIIGNGKFLMSATPQCSPANVIVKWLNSLNTQQQALCLSLFQSAGA